MQACPFNQQSWVWSWFKCEGRQFWFFLSRKCYNFNHNNVDDDNDNDDDGDDDENNDAYDNNGDDNDNDDDDNNNDEDDGFVLPRSYSNKANVPAFSIASLINVEITDSNVSPNITFSSLSL